MATEHTLDYQLAELASLREDLLALVEALLKRFPAPHEPVGGQYWRHANVVCLRVLIGYTPSTHGLCAHPCSYGVQVLSTCDGEYPFSYWRIISLLADSDAEQVVDLVLDRLAEQLCNSTGVTVWQDYQL